MGTVAASMRDTGLQHMAFSPPPCGYAATQCETVHACTGAAICMRLFTPTVQQTIPPTISETQQRWRARMVYTDTKLLCIFSHGNSDDIGTCAPYSQWLADTFDMNVVAYDYPGYGLSEQTTSTEKGMCDAIDAVYDVAVNRMGVPSHQVLIWGKSLGTGPSVFLASQQRPLSGVVLVSPLASGARCLCQTTGLPRALVGAADAVFMPSVTRIPSVTVPVCVVHGTADTVVSVDNAEAIVACCGSQAAYPPLYVPAGHNDIEATYGPRFVSHIARFLEYTANIATLPYHRDLYA